ncbi:MAG: TatD family hydrolase [bacterium]|nr:TatD family hydrolase [bacterium]
MKDFLVDSHCHLNYPDFEKDLPDVLGRAKEAGVGHFLSICTQLGEMEAILKIANSAENIWATAGVHPHDAADELERLGGVSALKKSLSEIATTHKDKIVALGETGLDYYYDNSPREEQRSSFDAHIAVGIEHDLPLIVHTRDAEEDTIDFLNAHKGKVRGVLHCFSGSAQLAQAALDLGFYISISGIVTFKKADELRQIVQDIVPVDRLLVETDSPFLAPIPHRGKRNEPAFVRETAARVADLKDMSLEDLTKTTTQNFFDLFQKKVG